MGSSDKEKRSGFGRHYGTPDSPVNSFIFFTVGAWQCLRKKPELDADLLKEADTPYILLANHECFEDFYYLHLLPHPVNPAYVINKYYCTGGFTGWLRRHVGFIPKKLFTHDTETIFGIKRVLKKGYPVIIYPKGRLSPDGRTNPIVEKGGRLFKIFNADIVLVNVDGGYYAHPKWRKKPYSADVKITVKRVIKKNEIASMSADELDSIISRTLYNDAALSEKRYYPRKDKAEGLEGILYRCIDCGTLYRMEGRGNELICHSCGAVRRIDESYHFGGTPGVAAGPEVSSIGGYYDRIRKMEEKDIGSLYLHAKVRTKVFDDNCKVCLKENGECTLDKDAFSYRSATEEFTIPTEKISALAFSCQEEFELYYNGRLHYFYPEEDPVQAARWALAVDILTDMRNKSGKEK